MRIMIHAALLAAAATAAGGHSLRAQNAGPRGPLSPGTLVALIDVGYVFKHHARFGQQMEGIKQEIQSYDAQLAQQRRAIEKQRAQLQELAVGSPDYKRLEVQITRRMSEISVQAQLKKKEILEQEAQAYLQAYNEVVAATAEVAESHQIGLVLRFDGQKIDRSNRGSVLKGVNRAVVYQRNLDITRLVLERINSPRAMR